MEYPNLVLSLYFTINTLICVYTLWVVIVERGHRPNQVTLLKVIVLLCMFALPAVVYLSVRGGE